jgi:hypothetical protein
MAFASDAEGEIWLGAYVRMRSRARNCFFEVEWYEMVDGTYSLWDDDLDFVRSERLLVRDIGLVCAHEGSERFSIAAWSRASLDAAVVKWLERSEPWFVLESEFGLWALCGDGGNEELDNGVICDTCDGLYHRDLLSFSKG